METKYLGIPERMKKPSAATALCQARVAEAHKHINELTWLNSHLLLWLTCSEQEVIVWGKVVALSGRVYETSQSIRWLDVAQPVFNLLLSVVESVIAALEKQP